jgi:hypothetical protein
MDNGPIATFFAETTTAFQFLEATYGYTCLEQTVKYPEEFRDTEAQVSYVGPQVGVRIFWVIGDGVIDVLFVELAQAGIFPVASVYPFRDQSMKFYVAKQKRLDSAWFPPLGWMMTPLEAGQESLSGIMEARGKGEQQHGCI